MYKPAERYLVKECACCGKIFDYEPGWAYKTLGGKNGNKHQFFCTWKCLRQYEKDHPKRFQSLRVNNKRA